ncbi:hypothetical protein ACIO8F_28585 [Streptomyces sp. NPDC087228]|uniref:hypothetical protein n=1 Tax=Streptomyces sp. NPDC087228 TaxID=3365772 RepID=UPI0037F29654
MRCDCLLAADGDPQPGTGGARHRTCPGGLLDGHGMVEAGPEVLIAAESCPVEAIRVTDTATGEVLAPTD